MINQAQLLFPVHVVDTVSANNSAIDDDLISADVLMRDGFE